MIQHSRMKFVVHKHTGPKRRIYIDILFPSMKNELSSLSKRRLICVPLTLQSEVLGMLHDGHPGITAMQSPNINSDSAQEIEKCFTCQQSRQNDPNSSLHPSPESW
ncbi:hypothetical protein JTB14_015692 [Gonioctena quinquepunctata]|nr:hypothetical protein JTB14_015692 [Gonioctena quinquepunctata]